ncbi:MAG: MogA/MoaB family molybdenum cofactor biosynthesis protein [Gemmatimonadota bacterium]|nr:MAG: MogA/MoaB family molybdenum cofactor biosynthesis protein [Gemmatimonadota bacterium]
MIRVAILTVSDQAAAGQRRDSSGEAAREWVERNGWSLVEHLVVPDETGPISAQLARWADGGQVDLIVTLGGTGFGPRDTTPEATSAILERHAPGLAESLRASGMRSTPFAMLGRGLAGIRGRALIVNLPGSEQAVGDGLEILAQVVSHAVELLRGRTEH